MVLVSIPAFKSVASLPASTANITSFAQCSAIAEQYNTAPIQYIRAAAIGIYTLAELIYSIVILRLFVSNILKLSIFCKTLPFKEAVRCFKCISLKHDIILNECIHNKPEKEKEKEQIEISKDNKCRIFLKGVDQDRQFINSCDMYKLFDYYKVYTQFR